jgi:WD40 repeat protein
VFTLGALGWLHSVNQVAFGPDGDTVYAFGSEHGLKCWSVKSGVLLRERRSLRGAVLAIKQGGDLACFQPHERQVTNLIDLSTMRKTPLKFESAFYPETFSPDGRFVMSVNWDDGYVRVFDVSTGRAVLRIEASKKCAFMDYEGQAAIAVATYGQSISNKGTIPLAPGSNTGDELKKLNRFNTPIDVQVFPVGSSGSTLNASFNAMHAHMHIDTPADKVIGLPGRQILLSIDIHSSPLALELKSGTQHTLPTGPGYDTELATSADGTLVAIGEASGAIRVIETDSWQVRSLIPGIRELRAVATSADSDYVAVVCGAWWDYARPAWLLSLPPSRSIESMRQQSRFLFSTHDGRLNFDWRLRWLFAPGSKEERIRERVLSLEQRYAPLAGRREDIALSKNGKWLLLMLGDQEIGVIDVATEKIRFRARHAVKGDIVRCSISENGDHAALGFSFGSKLGLLLDLPNGKETELNGAIDTMKSLTFSPDGKWLATADAYQEFISLTPLQRKRRIKPPIAHAQAVHDLVFTPDGKYLISAGADGQLVFWHLPSFERQSTLLFRGDGGPEWMVYEDN